MRFVIVHPDMVESIRSEPGFVPAARYGSMAPVNAEIGALEGIRFVFGGFEERTEFVTDVEFAAAMALAGFERDSKISGHIGMTTYICLAPGEI